MNIFFKKDPGGVYKLVILPAPMNIGENTASGSVVQDLCDVSILNNNYDTKFVYFNQIFRVLQCSRRSPFGTLRAEQICFADFSG